MQHRTTATLATGSHSAPPCRVMPVLARVGRSRVRQFTPMRRQTLVDSFALRGALTRFEIPSRFSHKILNGTLDRVFGHFMSEHV